MKPALLIGAIGLALGGFLGYHKVYVPAQERARLIERQVDHEQARQLAQVKAAGLLQQAEEYRRRLPATPEPSWLVRKAVALGREAGIELASIIQEPPQPFPSFTRLGTSLQLTATYHELGALLDTIERSGDFIRVDRIEVSNPAKDGRAAVRLVLSTFHVPPVLEAPSATRTSRQ